MGGLEKVESCLVAEGKLQMFRNRHHGMFLTFQATCMLWPQVRPIVWLHLPWQSAALLKGSPAKGQQCLNGKGKNGMQQAPTLLQTKGSPH